MSGINFRLPQFHGVYDTLVAIGNSVTVNFPMIFELNGVTETENHKVQIKLENNDTIVIQHWRDRVCSSISDQTEQKLPEKSLKEIVTNLSKKEQLELYKYMHNGLDCRIN
jgi:antitoxin component of MazEF toxin-antitoxin module